MPIPTIRDQQAHLGWGKLPAAVLSVVSTLVIIAPVAIFFWPDDVDPQVSGTLQYSRAGQRQTTTGIAAINDRAAEKFLAQTRGIRTINNSLLAEDQFLALSDRLSTLQDAMTRIRRDNADLAEQLRATQTQIAQDNALVAQQLKALTQMIARPAVLAMGSEERERRLGQDTTRSTATAPAVTRSRTVHRKDQAQLRVDGSSGAAVRSRASPAPTGAPGR